MKMICGFWGSLINLLNRGFGVINTDGFLFFVGAALLMAITPGPNMIYLISRSLCQGRVAGITSWFGVVLGFTIHMLCASFGLTALFIAVPFAYDGLKICGALYLLWLAWQAIRPGARSPFEVRDLPYESSRRLFSMGLLTSVLNPKVAIFYLSVLPQFIQPEQGAVLMQSIVLGVTQVFIGSSINLLVTLFAASLAAWLLKRPTWLAMQRYVMGAVLGWLAAKLLMQRQT